MFAHTQPAIHSFFLIHMPHFSNRYTLVRNPTIPDEYYVFNDNLIEHGQFGTRFPLRDDPYHPDYEPFCITLTPAVTTQALPSIPEQTKGAGPSNVPHTPSVQLADLHTPRESQPAESSKEMTQQKKQIVKNPLITLTLQKKQICLYTIHKSQKDTNN